MAWQAGRSHSAALQQWLSLGRCSDAVDVVVVTVMVTAISSEPLSVDCGSGTGQAVLTLKRLRCTIVPPRARDHRHPLYGATRKLTHCEAVMFSVRTTASLSICEGKHLPWRRCEWSSFLRR